MKLLLLLLITINLYSATFSSVVDQIKLDEGFRPTAYRDNRHWSVGYGTNLSYITEAEASLLLNHRLAIRLTQLQAHSWFNKQSSTRKSALLQLTYQLGYNGILKFKKMIWHLKRGYYTSAAKELKASRWFKQSGLRAKRLVQQMRTNKD